MPVEPTKRVYETPPIRKDELSDTATQKKKSKQQKKEEQKNGPETGQTGKVDIKI
jgi:hypothetical protein